MNAHHATYLEGTHLGANVVNNPTHDPEQQMQQLRRDVQILEDRQRQIMELIDCPAPEKLLHDLRNKLNELQLLRLLAANQA